MIYDLLPETKESCVGFQMMLGGTVGLSCGVQCVALPYQEEIVVRLMKEVEQGIREDNWERFSSQH